MHGKLITITAEGVTTVEDITSPPGLEKLQSAVGGYIEAIPYFETFGGQQCVAFCNEEGKLSHQQLPPNDTATQAWTAAMMAAVKVTPAPDFLVGTVAIITGDSELLEAM